MDLEKKIRSQIEAILINDAKTFAELRQMASQDEPLETEAFAEERNLYQRIISSYRSALGEVNALLEENIRVISGFCSIVENTKEKHDFEEICVQILECVLQDFGADYCGILFKSGEAPFCLEGIHDGRNFVRIHTNPSLLNSSDFEQKLSAMAAESADCLNIGDIYREPLFNSIDFPSVVRSLACSPIMLGQQSVGLLVISHSLPSYFKDNHLRILKLIAGITASLRFLTSVGAPPPKPPAPAPSNDDSDVHSLVLLHFESPGTYGQPALLDNGAIRSIRQRMKAALNKEGSILSYDERDLVILFPGMSQATLPARVGTIRRAFEDWKKDQGELLRNASLTLAFSTFDGEDNLLETLKIASMIVDPEHGEDADAQISNTA